MDSKSGETMVKVGESPYNGRSYLRLATGRRYWRSHSGLYKPRRVVVFEAAHGAVPPGCIVRRVMPDVLDDSLGNLVLITRSVNVRLNLGSWTKPLQPWATVPLDRDLRLAIIAAAVARDLAARGGSAA